MSIDTLKLIEFYNDNKKNIIKMLKDIKTLRHSLVYVCEENNKIIIKCLDVKNIKDNK